MNTQKDIKTITVLLTFLKLGLTSFGGPIAHLAYFRKEFVEQKKWLSDSQFSQLLTICQFLPGPASSQMGFAIGLLKSGWLGAISAFIAFTIPSVVLLAIFAAVLPSLGSEIGQAAIGGLKIVAFVVVADAVIGMSQKLCANTFTRILALAAAAAVLLFDNALSQLLAVIIAGLLSSVFYKPDNSPQHHNLSVNHGRKTGMVLFSIFTVLLAIFLFFPVNSALITIAEVFYRAGALVFGGGHVVLPLLETSIIENQWLTQEEFLTGYGAAQAIPGPMFALSAYVGALVPNTESTILAITIAVIFMFLPGFLLVSAALPFWQSISSHSKTQGIITGVNAAVVGILGAALYDPIFTAGIPSVNELIIAIIGFGILNSLKLSPLYLVIWCVAAKIAVVLI
jgi:chromate transporter